MKLLLTTIAVFTFATAALHAQLIESAKPEPTTAELAAQSIIDSINSEIEHRVAVHKTCFETLWKNPREGATPAAILAQLGTKAALVFQFSRENLDHIDRCAKLVGKTRADFITDAECTPPVELVFNANGTVTIKH